MPRQKIGISVVKNRQEDKVLCTNIMLGQSLDLLGQNLDFLGQSLDLLGQNLD